MKKYVTVWLFLFAIVGYEYFALNFSPNLSLLNRLQKRGLISATLQFSVAPGRTISLWLGWVGLGLMVIMNVYSVRKRFGFMQSWGKLSDWLNFHVFCGLVGPTFILFHCNFKVRGIVGISFWSMVISFASGIVGRYFYVQMLKGKNNFEVEAEQKEKQLAKILSYSKIHVPDAERTKYKQLALAYVGMPARVEDSLNPFAAMFSAIAGDIRLAFKYPARPHGWPRGTEFLLAEYALSKRKASFLIFFQKLMGYWHAFHFPFAVFMYIVAVIHVAAALVLGV